MKNKLPFKKQPRWITIEIVVATIFWFNNYQNILGLSTELIPRDIITSDDIE